MLKMRALAGDAEGEVGAEKADGEGNAVDAEGEIGSWRC